MDEKIYKTMGSAGASTLANVSAKLLLLNIEYTLREHFIIMY